MYREGGNEFYTLAFTNGSLHSQTVNIDRANTLILKRQGGFLSGFFFANGGATVVQVGGPGTVGASGTGPTRFNLDISTSNPNAGGATIVFQGFHVKTGTISCPPSGLRAVVGDGQVYLSWDPSLGPVDGYNIFVDQIIGNTSVPLGTVNPSGQLIPDASSMISVFAKGGSVQNGQLYKFSVNSVSSNTQSTVSTPVFALPAGFSSFQLPPPPTHPILFLHGISDRASTWSKTIDYFSRTLGWTRNGGNLFYRPTDHPLTDSPQVDATFQPASYFYTVNFSDNFANAGGISRQGDEVGGFIRYLETAASNAPLSLVAHSMGGLAARSYIERNAAQAKTQIFELITYGTPHRGVDLNFFKSVAIGNLPILQAFFPEALPLISSRGAMEMDANCGGSPSSFLQELNSLHLPAEIKYSALRGHANTFLQLFGGLGDRFGNCLQSPDGIIRSDLVVSIESADPNGLTPSQVPLITTNRLHIQQTEDFPAILCALDTSCAIVQSMSPVDMEITAPSGRKIAQDFAAIPGASYMNISEGDGHEGATVIIPFPEGGQYTVRTIPKLGALPTDTFTITIIQNGVKSTIADNMKIQDSPPDGFHPNVDSRPFANAGPFQTIECMGANKTFVILNGSASNDQDGDPLKFLWKDSQGNIVGTTAIVNVMAHMGTQIYNLTVTDPLGLTATAQTNVTVRDTTHPALRVTVTPKILWPPNKELVQIRASLQVSDACDPNPTIKLVSIMSNDPDDDQRDVREAAIGTDDRTFLLRARRADNGKRRVYTITYRATDHSGNSTTATADVRVPGDLNDRGREEDERHESAY